MSEKNNRFVLIVSTGKQDLKVVCIRNETPAGGGETKSGIELRVVNKKCRIFHEYLVRSDFYQVALSAEEICEKVNPVLGEKARIDPEQIPLGRKAEFIDLDQQGECIRLRDKCWTNRDDTRFRVHAFTDEHGYLLFPGKLHSVVNKIEKNQWPIAGVLVFYTDRETLDSGARELPKEKRDYLNRLYLDEPFGTGPILARARQEIRTGEQSRGRHRFRGLRRVSREPI